MLRDEESTGYHGPQELTSTSKNYAS